MKRVNVCLAAPLPPPAGGIANWTKVLIGCLDKKRVPYTVIDLSPKRRITEKSGKLRRLRTGIARMIGRLGETEKVLKNGSFTALHLTSSGSLGLFRDFLILGKAKKFGIPAVYHLHYGRIPEMRETKGWEYRMLCACLHRAKKAVAIDRRTERTLRKAGFQEKTVYLPNGIDLSDLPRIEESPKNILTYLGWVIPKKGIEELISVWSELTKSEKRGWILKIVGPYEKEYVKRFLRGTEEDIFFAGELSHDEALHVLNEGKGFILPSHTEGFPYAVLEAMALGKRIIATKVGNLPEMLKGTEAILIAKQDREALRKAVLKLIESEKNTDPSAREKVKREYEIGIVTERYKKLWEEG